MYHKIHPNSPTMWYVTVNDFYRQMSELDGKEVVYFEDYDPKNTNQVVITFDGIYKNVVEFALPILRHFNYPFELFLTSNSIGVGNEFDSSEPEELFATYDELILLKANQGRLQWHTKSHLNLKNVKDLNIIINELTIPNELKQLDSEGFNWFAYPHGEFNEIVVNEVKKRFNGAVSCIQGNDDDSFILNRLTVVNTTRIRPSTIACIIASYNYGSYLIEALESVLRQTIVPDEILISDDCSDDETQLIAEAYVVKYPNLISYNRNKQNMGVVDHFNKAIHLTSSDYVFFLGADNKIFSNYIEESAKILDSNINTAIAYTDFILFGLRSKIAYEGFQVNRQAGLIEKNFYKICFPNFTDRNDLLVELVKGNFIHGSSMFKRIAFDQVGGYKSSNTAEDYNLFKRIIYNGWDAKKVLTTQLEYRQHSAGQVNNLVSLHNSLNLYKKLYLQRKGFEKSKIYKYAFYVFKLKKSTPKKIIKTIVRKFLK